LEFDSKLEQHEHGQASEATTPGTMSPSPSPASFSSASSRSRGSWTPMGRHGPGPFIRAVVKNTFFDIIEPDTHGGAAASAGKPVRRSSRSLSPSLLRRADCAWRCP